MRLERFRPLRSATAAASRAAAAVNHDFCVDVRFGQSRSVRSDRARKMGVGIAAGPHSRDPCVGQALRPVPPGLRPKPKLRCGFPFGFALAQRLRFRLDRPVRESGFGNDPKAELPRASSRRATPPSLAPLRAPKSLRRSVAGGVRGAFRFRRAAPGHICKLSQAAESRQHNRLWIKRITGISPAPRRAGYGRRNRARRPVRIRTRWAQ